MDQADCNLGVDKYRPAVNASVQSLQSLLFIDQYAENEAALSPNKHAK